MERKKFTLDDIRMLTSTTIPNSWAAEALNMKPERLAEYARTGYLDDKWHTIISGNTVKHSREGFLKYWEG